MSKKTNPFSYHKSSYLCPAFRPRCSSFKFQVHASSWGTARLVFGAVTPEELKEKRRVAKIVNFGVAYAIEAFGLAQRTGLSRAEAKKAIADYYETYKGVRAFMRETPEKAREQGYIATLEGRRRPLSGSMTAISMSAAAPNVRR